MGRKVFKTDLPILGVAELAEALHLNRQAIYQRLDRGTIPEPVVLSCGSVWFTHDIVKWLRSDDCSIRTVR